MKHAEFMKRILILCVIFALFVSGCGISGRETDSAGKDTQTDDGGSKKPAALPEKFRLADEKEEGKEGEESREEPYYVREYADYGHGNFPVGTPRRTTYRLHAKGQFILNRISTPREGEDDWDEDVYVECYQENQFSPAVREIRFDQEEIKDGDIESFDVLEEGYVFAVTCKNSEQEGPKERHYAVYTDWEGAPVKVLEATPETVPEIDRLPESYQLYVDGKGNLYEVYSKNILVMNPEGQQIGSLDLSEGKRTMVWRVLKEDGGSLLFAVSLGQGQYRFLSLNEENKWQERGVLDFKQAVDFVGISGGEIYLCDNSDLVAWNVDSGSRRKVIPLSQLGYTFGDKLFLLGDPEGDFRVRCIRNQEDYGMLLSHEKGFETDSISLVSLGDVSYWGDVVRGCGDFNRKTPGCSVVAEELSEKDLDRSRYLMDLVLGEGSDILYVTEEDMKMLAEAGALADLGTLLSEETLQALYPVVLELGTREGMLAGLTPQIDIRTMATNRSLWDGGTWTMQDIQKILTEHPEIQEIMSFMNLSLHSSGILYWWYGNDLENSGLYDRNTGESHFEDMGFAGTLEMIKKYNVNPVEKEWRDKLRDGDCPAVLIAMDTFIQFSEAMSQHGGDINMVGFPLSGTMAKHVASAHGYYVVNKKSQKQEAIRRFLEYMMGTANLANVEAGYGNVRRDMIDQCVKRDAEGNYLWAMENGHKYQLELKKDGTLYTQEWEAFLSECHPAQKCEEIWEIVEEESDQFFEGTLDARTAVKRIDSRVTLYLKEQK